MYSKTMKVTEDPKAPLTGVCDIIARLGWNEAQGLADFLQSVYNDNMERKGAETAILLAIAIREACSHRNYELRQALEEHEELVERYYREGRY